MSAALRRFDEVELIMAGGAGTPVHEILTDRSIRWRGARIMAGGMMDGASGAGMEVKFFALGNNPRADLIFELCTGKNNLTNFLCNPTPNIHPPPASQRAHLRIGLNKRWFQTTNAYISDPACVNVLFRELLPRIVADGGTVLVMTSDAARGAAAGAARRGGEFELTDSAAGGAPQIVPASDNMAYTDQDLTERVMAREPGLAAIYAKWAEMTGRGVQIVFDDVLCLFGTTLGQSPSSMLDVVGRVTPCALCDLYTGAEPLNLSGVDASLLQAARGDDGGADAVPEGAVPEGAVPEGAAPSEATHGIVGLVPSGPSGKVVLAELRDRGGRAGEDNGRAWVIVTLILGSLSSRHFSKH
jgi:hypothetical protein